MKCLSGLIVIVIFFLAGIHIIAEDVSVRVKVVQEDCSDGIDNDGDGLIDYPADPGCDNASDTNEVDPVFDCSDGIDNDGDGLIDYPADPGCDNASDTSEINISQGGGSGVNDDDEQNFLLLSGYAFATTSVDILLDGIKVATVGTRSDGRFSYEFSDMGIGAYNISFLARDKNNTTSLLYTIPVSIETGDGVVVSQIFIPPTIRVSSGIQGKIISGYTVPGAEVQVRIQPDLLLLHASADQKGYYEVVYGGLVTENMTVQATAAYNSLQSIWGKKTILNIDTVPIQFQYGERGDFNTDNKVDIVDYSIAAYWYKKNLPPEVKEIEKQIFNGDGIIDIYDLSILAYYWTG